MGELFDKLCNRSVLEAAWQRILKKNARGGIDGIQPQDLKEDIEKTLDRLSDDLRQHRYAPIPLAQTAIPKFNGSGRLC